MKASRRDQSQLTRASRQIEGHHTLQQADLRPVFVLDEAFARVSCAVTPAVVGWDQKVLRRVHIAITRIEEPVAVLTKDHICSGEPSVTLVAEALVPREDVVGVRSGKRLSSGAIRGIGVRDVENGVECAG